MSQTPLGSYQDRRTAFAAEWASARKASAALSNARLGVVLAALAAFLWFIFHDDLIPSLLAFSAGVIGFIALMIRHDKVLARERLGAQLTGLNESGLQRLEGAWTRFPDDGREFADEAHPYASDLDCFGPASLFQWLNAAQTRYGRLALSLLLARPQRSPDRIAGDQDMVRELAPRLDWRQRFQAAGGFPPAPRPKEDPDALLAWAEDATPILPRPFPAAAFRFLPLFSFAFALAVFFRYGLTSLMILPFLAQLAIASWNQRRHGRLLDGIRLQKGNLEIYLELLALLESAGFTGPGLGSLAASLRNPSGTPASRAVRGLQRLSDHLETRLNPILHLLVNALFLWDLQWLWVFRRWRRENGPSLRSWLEAVARVEALSSLATAAFENPDWAFPEVSEAGPLVEAEGLAHPLIPAVSRVGNDLRIGKAGEVLIITGSNMSGKSTLMRTVGVNLVLAYAGAPACARRFRCASVEVHTSMRLRDDLEKRISSFYAELLRIKGIVEAARSGKKVLFLVDEIFRGTNSKDRHAGAMAVLRQLHGLEAAGLVSTHDLELARLEELEPGSFRNLHFQEEYADGEIRFDYKMREGVSRTTNAIHLIRMVGLGEQVSRPPTILF
ncbi:MAG TPA: DNA mismatch repair protein [Fibrobacteria bacterium]|nr:DNA mismatch repair protein [Fibrobacteria bacterium]